MTRAADLAKLIAGGGTITVADNSDTLTLESTDADANVGPVLNLHRNSASPADGDLTGRIVFKADDDAGNAATFARIEATAVDVSNGGEDGRLDFFTAKDDAFNAAVSILGTDVGIGTSSPATKLSLVSDGAGGDIHVKNGSGQNALLELAGNNNTCGSTSMLLGQTSDGTANLFNRANGNLVIGTNNTERMRIDSSGNLLVATTDANPGNNSGGSDVGVVLDTNGKVLATTNNAEVMVLNRQNGDGDIAEFREDGSPVGSIGKTNGQTDIYIGSGDVGLRFGDSIDQIIAYDPSSNNSRDDAIDLGRSNVRFDDIFATNGTIQTSDKNEKNTIVDSDLGIDFVNLLTPKSYKFNNKTRTHYGLIAQDVETVLGSIKKDASQFAGFCKDDISEKQDGSEYRYGLRYHEFISPMIQAIKDLKAEVDTLKAKVATLESK